MRLVNAITDMSNTHKLGIRTLRARAGQNMHRNLHGEHGYMLMTDN